MPRGSTAQNAGPRYLLQLLLGLLVGGLLFAGLLLAALGAETRVLPVVHSCVLGVLRVCASTQRGATPSVTLKWLARARAGHRANAQSYHRQQARRAPSPLQQRRLSLPVASAFPRPYAAPLSLSAPAGHPLARRRSSLHRHGAVRLLSAGTVARVLHGQAAVRRPCMYTAAHTSIRGVAAPTQTQEFDAHEEDYEQRDQQDREVTGCDAATATHGCPRPFATRSSFYRVPRRQPLR